MKNKTIRQTISFHASAHDVYELLMDEKNQPCLPGVLHGSAGTSGGRL